MSPSDLDDKRITRLVQLLRSTDDLFKSPDGGCLSPLGEYNLNLGIQKVRLSGLPIFYFVFITSFLIFRDGLTETLQRLSSLISSPLREINQVPTMGTRLLSRLLYH